MLSLAKKAEGVLVILYLKALFFGFILLKKKTLITKGYNILTSISFVLACVSSMK